jgi:hypothetical protein
LSAGQQQRFAHDDNHWHVRAVITSRQRPYSPQLVRPDMATKRSALVIGCLIAGIAVIGLAANASASGDNNCWNHGEDGMYEENNNNPYDDATFPGEAEQKRGGIVWPSLALTEGDCEDPLFLYGEPGPHQSQVNRVGPYGSQ